MHYYARENTNNSTYIMFNIALKMNAHCTIFLIYSYYITYVFDFTFLLVLE